MGLPTETVGGHFEKSPTNGKSLGGPTETVGGQERFCFANSCGASWAASACGGLKALFYNVKSAAGEKKSNSPCKTASFPSKILFFAPAASPKMVEIRELHQTESNY